MVWDGLGFKALQVEIGIFRWGFHMLLNRIEGRSLSYRSKPVPWSRLVSRFYRHVIILLIAQLEIAEYSRTLKIEVRPSADYE